MTLPSIIVSFSCTLVWMVLILPLISCSSKLFSKVLVTVPGTPFMIGITITFIFYCFFFSLAGSKYSFIFLLSFIFLSGLLEWQNPLDDNLFSSCYLTLSLVFWPGLSDPFVKFQSLVQFLLDHLSRPFMPRFVFLLHHFAAFVFYGINHFISVTTWPKLLILQCIINSLLLFHQFFQLISLNFPFLKCVLANGFYSIYISPGDDNNKYFNVLI